MGQISPPWPERLNINNYHVLLQAQTKWKILQAFLFSFQQGVFQNSSAHQLQMKLEESRDKDLFHLHLNQIFVFGKF